MADPILTEIRIIVADARFHTVERIATAAREASGQTFVRLSFGRAGLLDPPDDGQSTFTCQHVFRRGPANICVFCGDKP